jgi:N12 class adenine-specific DNA methylase
MKFVEWVWSDLERTERLVRLYNDEFNSTVLPKFDGSHLTFPGMSNAIKPRGYQTWYGAICWAGI